MRPVTDQPLALRGYGECCLTSQIRSRFLVGWPNQTALAFDDHGYPFTGFDQAAIFSI